MRWLLTSFFLLATTCSMALAGDYPLAGIDPLFYTSEGWQWGAYSEEDSEINASDTGIVFNINPGGDGTTNGGLGISFDGLQYEQEDYELEVKFRVLPDNTADTFRVILNEPNTGDPDNPAEEFQYYVNGLLDYEENEWITITRPLTEITGIWPPDGDKIPAAGLASIQLGSWDLPGSLNIELGGIYINPINPTPDGVLFEFNSNNARRAWRWGAFNDEESTIEITDTSIKLDINPAAEGEWPGRVNGGMGSAWLKTDFEDDPENFELVVKAKLGENNEATTFNVVLFDNDGLYEIIEWGDDTTPRVLDQEAEEHQYQFSTAELSEDEFIELRIPMTNSPSYSQKIGAAKDNGDGLPNYGMYGVQIQSVWDSVERLNLEIESIQIVDVTFVPTNPCDLNGNGTCDAADIDTWTQAFLGGSQDPKWDLDGNGNVNMDDHSFLIHDLFETYIGDSNLDHEFNTADFVQVFTAGKYETGQEAGWAEGDWTADMLFNTADFVAAFTEGGYEKGPFPSGDGVSAVPEPSSLLLLAIALLGLVSHRRRAS